MTNKNYSYVWGIEKLAVDWRYANVKLPMDTLYLLTNSDIHILLQTFVGDDYEFDSVRHEATTGSSGIGGWEEGDIWHSRGGKRFVLSYDFIQVDDEMGRVFRYVVHMDE